RTPAIPRASVAVADTVTLLPESVAPLAGAKMVTTGPLLSRTVTVNDASMVLPRVSAAVQLTVVVPIGNVAPLKGVQLTSTLPSTASVAEAVNVSPAPSGPVASTFVFEGTVMVGAVVSLTVTVKLLAPTFARLSLAVQVTVVAPSGNVAPLAGVQLTATGPSIASVADALNVNTAPAGPVASTLAFAGTVTIGAPVSLTVMVNEAEPVLPCASVAVQVAIVVPIGNFEAVAVV